MGFALSCPRCGHIYETGVHLESVSFQGIGGMNIVVPCPRCGHEWDATGGGDGTWSTVGGRLVRVAEAVSRLDGEEVRALLASLQQARADRDSDAAAGALASLGVQTPRSGWRDQGNRMELWAIVTLLVTVLALVLPRFDRGEGVTPEEVGRMIEDAQRDERHEPSRQPQRFVGRNDLCPCGSGAKFKRCHGGATPPGVKVPRGQ